MPPSHQHGKILLQKGGWVRLKPMGAIPWEVLILISKVAGSLPSCIWLFWFLVLVLRYIDLKGTVAPDF
jgi:hypothetical protein